MDLEQNNKRVAGRDPLANGTIESNVYPSEIHAAGKQVVVIGGGDTGSGLCGHPRTGTRPNQLPSLRHCPPPAEWSEFMPWPGYLMQLENNHPRSEEGCERHGRWLPKSF